MNLNLKKIDYNNKFILDKILEWRNDEETRYYSNNSNIITNEIFELIINKYKESGIDPLIIYLDNIEVGVISFVDTNNKKYIGINIDKNYRKMKIGSLAIKEYIKKLNLENKNEINYKIYALVKKENISSIKLFEKYFSLLEETDNFKEYYLDT